MNFPNSGGCCWPLSTRLPLIIIPSYQYNQIVKYIYNQIYKNQIYIIKQWWPAAGLCQLDCLSSSSPFLSCGKLDRPQLSTQIFFVTGCFKTFQPFAPEGILSNMTNALWRKPLRKVELRILSKMITFAPIFSSQNYFR